MPSLAVVGPATELLASTASAAANFCGQGNLSRPSPAHLHDVQPNKESICLDLSAQSSAHRIPYIWTSVIPIRLETPIAPIFSSQGSQTWTSRTACKSGASGSGRRKAPPFLCRLGATANAVSQPDRQPRGWRDYGVGRNIAVLPRWFVRRPCLPLFEPRAHQSTSPFHPRPELYFPFRSFRAAIYHASHHRVANIRRSQSSIIGAYVIIFGIATALLEYQIPPQISRYASFLFSFIGRGVCKFPLRPSWCRFGSALVGVSLLTTARPQQSTFSSGPFSSTATSCASSPDPSSALSVWYTWPSNTFPPLSRRRTCGRPIKAGAPSRCRTARN